MVTHFFSNASLLAQQAVVPEKLPPPTRVAVLMALLGILLLGLLLIVIILLGGHWVRRLGSYRRGPAVPDDFIVSTDQSKKSKDPDHDQLPGKLSSNDTIRPDDTIVS